MHKCVPCPTEKPVHASSGAVIAYPILAAASILKTNA